ncbi:MAG: GHKL domain-containing protein [Deltaproteobacteria bacterium]|nr:GHKL domain-containing protein [Deltaproteobacteria bacterium]
MSDADPKDELQQLREQLIRSEKMAALGAMVAGVAHEINTPIGAIGSMHDTLRRALDKLTDALQCACPDYQENRKIAMALRSLAEASEVIGEGSQRVATIVKRLRNFARSDALEQENLDLNAALEDTLVLIHHQTKGRIAIKKNFAELPEVCCYRGQIHQVFLNILVNAVQAIENKGTIEIITARTDDRVTISISDDGRGIDPANLPQIFTAGFTTKAAPLGTGLGLAICQEIIQAHNGQITVQSELGRGTTFVIDLPLRSCL